jgi:orotidine-5'-phosphate decarboxylase
MEIYGKHPSVVVPTLADIVQAGAGGFVCSALEVETLRRKFPDKELVIPGVRSPGAEEGDQKRVDTPKNARDNGANHLVMGRQILGARDPVAEVQRVQKDELGIE